MTQRFFALFGVTEDRTFRVRTAALLDLYEVLGRTSRCLQDLQQLPWERQERVRALLEELRVMTDALTPSAPASSRARLDSSAIWRELQRRDDPEEMAEHWPTLAKYASDITGTLVSLNRTQIMVVLSVILKYLLRCA